MGYARARKFIHDLRNSIGNGSVLRGLPYFFYYFVLNFKFSVLHCHIKQKGSTHFRYSRLSREIFSDVSEELKFKVWFILIGRTNEKITTQTYKNVQIPEGKPPVFVDRLTPPLGHPWSRMSGWPGPFHPVVCCPSRRRRRVAHCHYRMG